MHVRFSKLQTLNPGLHSCGFRFRFKTNERMHAVLDECSERTYLRISSCRISHSQSSTLTSNSSCYQISSLGLPRAPKLPVLPPPKRNETKHVSQTTPSPHALLHSRNDNTHELRSGQLFTSPLLLVTHLSILSSGAWHHSSLASRCASQKANGGVSTFGCVEAVVNEQDEQTSQ